MPETAKAGRWNHGSSMAKSLRNRRFPNPRGGRWEMGTKRLGRGAVDERSEPRRGGTACREASAVKWELGYWG